MNRLSPLIVRRVGRFTPALAFERSHGIELDEAAGWLEEARLFATGWVAGLIFFGTFLS